MTYLWCTFTPAARQDLVPWSLVVFVWGPSPIAKALKVRAGGYNRCFPNVSELMFWGMFNQTFGVVEARYRSSRKIQKQGSLEEM